MSDSLKTLDEMLDMDVEGLDAAALEAAELMLVVARWHPTLPNKQLERRQHVERLKRLRDDVWLAWNVRRAMEPEGKASR